MGIKIIDYKAGNAPSVLNAVLHLGFDAELAHSASDIMDASHILLPGVGSAKETMESLREMNILDALSDAVFMKKTPFLGICVGLQILFDHSDEGDADCLGWLKGQVVKFDAARVRVPQMGWNKVSFQGNADISTHDEFFYFVNSYYAKPEAESDIWGVADYGNTFTAAVRKDNIMGVQFHIEKSGAAGLSLLRNILLTTTANPPSVSF